MRKVSAAAAGVVTNAALGSSTIVTQYPSSPTHCPLKTTADTLPAPGSPQVTFTRTESSITYCSAPLTDHEIRLLSNRPELEFCKEYVTVVLGQTRSQLLPDTSTLSQSAGLSETICTGINGVTCTVSVSVTTRMPFAETACAFRR